MIRWAGTGLTMIMLLTACETLPWDRRGQQGPTVDMTETADGVAAPVIPEPGLRLSTESRFADVPLPVGVREDADRTYVYESRDIQIGRMVYTIRESVSDVAQFYIREMPAAGWNLTSTLQAAGAELIFEKPTKRLQMSARSVGMARGGTQLILHLTPRETAQ